MRGNKSAFIADDLIFLILLIQLGVTTHSDPGSCRNPVTPPHPPSLPAIQNNSLWGANCLHVGVEWEGERERQEGERGGIIWGDGLLM